MAVSAIPSPSQASLLFRPAAERFHSRFDWLDSRHSFSFADHYDPAWMGFGPLRVINDDQVAPKRGFGMHPHRDMEIITVMVQGQLNHRDSMGHAEVLRAGEVQRMSAGTGVVHSEMNEGEQPCRFLQIWIQPSSNGIPPAYEQKHFQISDSWTALIDPDRSEESMAIHRPLRLWRARPTAGMRLSLPLASGSLGWIQMIDGAGQVMAGEASPAGDQDAPLALQQGDGLGFTAGALQAFEAAEQGADLLLFELR